MATRQRIVHLIGSLGSGGCEHMLLRTLPRLHDERFEQTVVTLFAPGSLTSRFEAAGVAVESVRARSLLELPGNRVRTVLRELRPALVLTYLAHADLAGRLIGPRLGAPILPFLRTTYNGNRYWSARLFERLTAPLVRHYLANSEAVASYYERSYGIARDRFTVLPNGIDLAAYDAADGSHIRAELGLDRRELLIVCVANLARNKGHRFLLNAFDRIANEWPQVRLVLVGEGAEQGALEAQRAMLAAKARIHLLGRRTDVPAILKAGAVFALPTEFEGMSNAIQEAMAARLPIITTDIPENRALVAHDRSGLLVPVGDAAALAAALVPLLDDAAMRERLGAAARETVEARFSMDAVLAQWRTMFAAQAPA